MACSKEELETSEEGLCPICSDVYKSPRRLPTCRHTFCENCLFTFVFDLKEQGKLDTSFECPVCRQAHPLQSTGEVTLEWIQTFPRATDGSETDKGSCDFVSGESDEGMVDCDLCAKNDVVISAQNVCIECQAYMCEGCVEAHLKFNALSSHTLLDTCQISDFHNLIADFQKYKKCVKHPDRDVELFCRDDETFICLVCATTAHKNCKNVVEASEISKESKEKIEELKSRIVEIQKHLAMIQRLSLQNNTCVKTQTEKVVTEVTYIKNKIADSLNIILENVAKGANQIQGDIDGKESVIIETVDRLKALFDKKLLYLDSVNKYCSTPEIFICSTQLEAEVEQLEDEVMTLDSTLETSNVERPILDVLYKISEQIEPSKMPDIVISNTASDQQPKYTRKYKMPPAFQVGQVEQHTVLITDKCTPTYTGIAVDEDGTLILSDSCSHDKCGNLCFYNPCQKRKNILKMNKPYSTTMINKHTVASTLPPDKRITVVSLRYEMRIEKSINTKYQPRCITSLSDGKVAISWTEPPGFSIADISGSTIQESHYFTQDSDGRTFQSFDFMAINEPRKLVIQPCNKDKAVYCFDFTGKPVFKYTNNLKKPKGVAIDSTTGSVFVCDESDDCIHQLSARGQPISVIRHTHLNSPLNVCFDKQRKCLWVTRYCEEYYDLILCLECA